jgi:hypothetical protein
MADWTDRTLALTAASLASPEYPWRATKPTVASTARTAITTISSARVNQSGRTVLRAAGFFAERMGIGG